MIITKECPFCHFENINSNLTHCAKCGYFISNILQENFNIAEFLKKNYQLYSIFGILVALFFYILKDGPIKIVAVFPLIIAIYIILHLTNKSVSIIGSRVWRDGEDDLRRESNFHYFIFFVINGLLIITLLASVPQYIRDFMGILLGIFIFIAFFSANFSNEQRRRVLEILIISVFLYEIFLFLFMAIPFLSKMTDNPIIAFYYNWGIIGILYLTLGGFLAYSLIGGYNVIHQVTLRLPSNDRQSIFHQDRERGIWSIELWIGIELLIAIILGVVLSSIKDLYSGL